jgi:hypothetical protein
MQLKVCESCGCSFLRPVPESAREGEKICKKCIETPLTEEEETQAIRSYPVHGVRLKG